MTDEKQEFMQVTFGELQDIFERMQTEKQAMDYVSDHTKDVNTMSNLMMISYGMQGTINMLARIIGVPEDLRGMDVPY